jgi:lactosylceramide 4-alpha-galactosyltransferase
MSIVDVGSLHSGRCREFNVLHKSSFNPVHFADWRKLFAKRPSSETGKPKWLTEEVFGVHTWNKLSFNELVYKNSTQEYARLARDNCPNIFSLAPNTF